MNTQNLQQKMVCYWQWLKRKLFTPIKCLTKSIELSLCDYSDACILVTGNITVTRTIAAAGNNPHERKQPLAAGTQLAFKNCVPFKYWN